MSRSPLLRFVVGREPPVSTPIERAAALRHRSITNAMVHAKVNKASVRAALG